MTAPFFYSWFNRSYYHNKYY